MYPSPSLVLPQAQSKLAFMIVYSHSVRCKFLSSQYFSVNLIIERRIFLSSIALSLYWIFLNSISNVSLLNLFLLFAFFSIINSFPSEDFDVVGSTRDGSSHFGSSAATKGSKSPHLELLSKLSGPAANFVVSTTGILSTQAFLAPLLALPSIWL